MNKITITVLLLFIFSCAYSQKYYPFLKNTEWHVQFYSFNTWDVWYYPGIDTVVKSKIYKKYYTTGSTYISMLREDTIQKKVWLRQNNDTAEYLLYDFSLGVGSKFVTKGGNLDSLLITQIDSVMTILGYRKRFKCVCQKPIPNHIVEIIESIGSTEEPLQIRNYLQDPGSMLVCSKQNNIQTYQSPYVNCKPNLLATEIKSEKDDEQYVLFPNPSNGIVFFNYKVNQNNAGIIRIADLMGKLIEEHFFNSNNTELQLNTSLQNGIYLYQVIVDDKIIATDKIVIIK